MVQIFTAPKATGMSLTLDHLDLWVCAFMTFFRAFEKICRVLLSINSHLFHLGVTHAWTVWHSTRKTRYRRNICPYLPLALSETPLLRVRTTWRFILTGCLFKVPFVLSLSMKTRFSPNRLHSFNSVYTAKFYDVISNQVSLFIPRQPWQCHIPRTDLVRGHRVAQFLQSISPSWGTEIRYLYSINGISGNEADNTAAIESASHGHVISEWTVGSDVSSSR
jgi:hypothetical protein